MTPLRKVAASFGYAFAGWRAAFQTQLNFRIQCLAAILVILTGYLFKISPNEWLWLTTSISLVLAAELFNSAIETLVDLVSPSYHEKAGRVKDISAGAVTILAINSLVTALVIFVPKFFS